MMIELYWKLDDLDDEPNMESQKIFTTAS